MEGLIEAPCLVCGATTRTGLHYGAITCYPCRAFFRRVPERKRPPVCRKGGRCPVVSTVTKHCPGCRFQVCLRIGMQLSQVLNEDQRRERFASSLQRKRALNAGEDDDSDDEIGIDPMTADTSVQDPSLPQPEEAEVLVLPKLEPNPLVPCSTMSLENLRFFTSTGAVPRHLCTPPPLMPNNTSGFQFTLPPNLPPFNLQSALIQQLQDQYNLARWQNQNPASTAATSHSNALTQNAFAQNSSIQKGLTQNGLTQNGLSQNGLISYPSTSNGLLRLPPPTFAQAAHHNRVRSSSSSYRPNFGNLKFPGGNKSLRGPPPLIEKPRSNFPSASCSSSNVPETNHSKVEAKEVSQRISVIRNSKRPIEEQVNGRQTNSNTMYEDLMETENTFDFATAATTSTTTATTTFATSTTTFGNRTEEHLLKNCSLPGAAGNLKFYTDNSLPEPWEPEVLINEIDSEMVELPMIKKYVHKKFNRSDGSDRSPPHKAMARPSVIRSTTGKPFDLSASCSESKLKTKECDLDTSDDCSLAELDIDLNEEDLDSIQSLCISFLVEEAPYMEEKKVLFFNTWGKVNLGEEVMLSYISFAKNRTNIPKTWLGMSGRQFRERYLSATCTLDIIDAVSQDALFRVLRQRLGYINVLPYIVAFNQRTADEQLNFMLADDDRKQWQDRDSNIEGVTSQTMLEYLPCPDKTRSKLLELMNSHKGHIFTDLSVHMLMVCLILFDSQDDDSSIRRVHDTSVNMLRGYLEVHSCQPEWDFKKVLTCVKDLPSISKARNKLMMDMYVRVQAKKPRLTEILKRN